MSAIHPAFEKEAPVNLWDDGRLGLSKRKLDHDEKNEKKRLTSRRHFLILVDPFSVF